MSKFKFLSSRPELSNEELAVALKREFGITLKEAREYVKAWILK
jgi:hypothetical protein